MVGAGVVVVVAGVVVVVVVVVVGTKESKDGSGYFIF